MNKVSRQIRWRELSTPRKVLVVVVSAAELALSTAAARDLSRRDARQVRGPKALWAPLIAVQPFGPVAYLALGRRR